jgi:predicted ATPase
MRLKAKNLGPIGKLDIDIKPLTILIGKNSLGKSYAAELIYVMLSVINDYRAERFRLGFNSLEEIYSYRRTIPKDSDIADLTDQIRKENLSDILIVEKAANLILESESNNLTRILEFWLERTYGVDLNKLVNINYLKSEIVCNFLTYVIFKAEISKRGQLKVFLTLPKDKLQKICDEVAPSLQNIKIKQKKKIYVEELMANLRRKLVTTSEEIEMKIDPWVRKRTPLVYYIPAGRAGLIESYDTVVEALFAQAASTPSSGLFISPLSGMANQFYGVLRSLNGEKGEFSKEITQDFVELINGNIKLTGIRIRPKQRTTRLRMVYHFNLGSKIGSIELTHAASMIKEIAPIYLILQELVKKGQFLIVEEPESHLHPGAQFRLTKIFTKLANLKVNVILTTHSPIMLRKFSHYIRKNTEGKSEFIEPKNAALYWIKEGDTGSISKELKVSNYGTLDKIPTYDEVSTELYEEEVNLYKEEPK